MSDWVVAERATNDKTKAQWWALKIVGFVSKKVSRTRYQRASDWGIENWSKFQIKGT